MGSILLFSCFSYSFSLKIDVGNNVLVKKKQFFENIDSHSLDVQQLARNMSCMLWSREERTVRSLEGTTSNRFGTPAKIMATPSKVAAVLGESAEAFETHASYSMIIYHPFHIHILCFSGTVKAQMLHVGDKEGPVMASTLTACRKSLGNKFAQDGYNGVRKLNLSPKPISHSITIHHVNLNWYLLLMLNSLAFVLLSC